jgi:hypothetical protein
LGEPPIVVVTSGPPFLRGGNSPPAFPDRGVRPGQVLRTPNDCQDFLNKFEHLSPFFRLK